MNDLQLCETPADALPIPHPAAAESALGNWFVLHVKSRQEKALGESLDALQIRYYLPLVEKVHYAGRRKLRAQLPLFPGYLFLRGTLDQAYAADRTQRVARVIPVVDQAKLAEELESIRRALEITGKLDPFPYLSRGVRVRVTAGPLRGIAGVVEDRNKRDRLILQVDVLGQATSLEIDGSLLEPIA